MNAAIPIRDFTPQPVLGVVKTTYPRIDLTTPAVNDAVGSDIGETDAWARRASAANGFGEAVAAPEASAPARSAVDLPTTPLEYRSAAFWHGLATIGQALRTSARRAIAGWREYRALRRTYNALAELDERTLKDIGLGAHEAGSIAAELAGRAQRTRIQALRSLQFLSL